jgi:hypothetical protein
MHPQANPQTRRAGRNCRKFATKNASARELCTAKYCGVEFFAPLDQSVVAAMSGAHGHMRKFKGGGLQLPSSASRFVLDINLQQGR